MNTCVLVTQNDLVYLKSAGVSCLIKAKEINFPITAYTDNK